MRDLPICFGSSVISSKSACWVQFLVRLLFCEWKLFSVFIGVRVAYLSQPSYSDNEIKLHVVSTAHNI